MGISNPFAAFTHYQHWIPFWKWHATGRTPNAFSRQRKQPRPTLFAALISGFAKSVQAKLDEFFAHLKLHACLASMSKASSGWTDGHAGADRAWVIFKTALENVGTGWAQDGHGARVMPSSNQLIARKKHKKSP